MVKEKVESTAPADIINDSRMAEAGGGVYFASPSAQLEFVPTGAAIFDCVLGGGWPIGRIVNIVGNKSTGKTLCAIEAAANFANEYPQGKIRYNEVEAAFDTDYAAALGMPIDKVDFVEDCFTVEDLSEDLDEFINDCKDEDSYGLYILDSLDAISDKAELERDIKDGSYGAAKAKKLSEMFRRKLAKNLRDTKILVMIISQVRDNIGVLIGRKTTRSGGKALDFYASIVVYLDHIKQLKVTKKGVERVVGVEIRVRCDKNKISLPFRECKFPIMFGYGIDHVTANLRYLLEVKKLDMVGLEEKEAKALAKEVIFGTVTNELRAKVQEIDEAVRLAWPQIETTFLPKQSKYG